MSLSKDKIKCPDCGSTVKTSYFHTGHKKTKKHLDSLKSGKQHTTKHDEKTRIIWRSNFKKQMVKKKSSMTDEARKYEQNLKKFLQRNPNKTQKDYLPRSQRKKVVMPKKTPKIASKVIEQRVKEYKQELEETKASEPIELQKKKKKEKIEIVKIELENIKNKEDLIQRLMKASKKKHKTVYDNIQRIKNIYPLVFSGKEWNFSSFEWLRDWEKIADAVSKKYTKSIKTKSNQYVSIAGILNYIVGFEKEQKIYSKLGSNIQLEVDEITKDNTLNARQLKTFINWAEVKKVGEWLTPKNGSIPFFNALYAIFTDIPTRRSMDYRLMKVVSKTKWKSLIKKPQSAKIRKFNYLVVGKNMRPEQMTIYNYKEGPRRKFAKRNGNYGQYVLDGKDFPNKLKDTLQTYIQEENIISTNFLFGLDKNKSQPYGDGPFSTLMSQNIFNTFAGVPMTVNGMRHAYVSWFFPKLKTYREKENMAWEIGSSIDEMSKTYQKVELVEDNQGNWVWKIRRM